MERALAEDFFINYDLCWQNRYFFPYDINHYLYEVVKEKNSEHMEIHAYGYNPETRKLELQKVIDKDFWLIAYKDFIFYDVRCWDIKWYV